MTADPDLLLSKKRSILVLPSFYCSYVATRVLYVTLNGQFFQMLGSDTSHTAIKAIGGGLNLPGGGALPPFKKH